MQKNKVPLTAVHLGIKYMIIVSSEMDTMVITARYETDTTGHQFKLTSWSGQYYAGGDKIQHPSIKYTTNNELLKSKGAARPKGTNKAQMSYTDLRVVVTLYT